jgi:hypothetical protein
MKTVHCSAEGAIGTEFVIRINYTEILTSACLSRKTQRHLQNLQGNLEIRNSDTWFVITSPGRMPAESSWALRRDGHHSSTNKTVIVGMSVCLYVRYSFCTVEFEGRLKIFIKFGAGEVYKLC